LFQKTAVFGRISEKTGHKPGFFAKSNEAVPKDAVLEYFHWMFFSLIM
jgi:hypothetical protein